MVRPPPITPEHFFQDAAAERAGFSRQFWLDAHNLYGDAVEQDPSQSLSKWDVPRTVRLPFGEGHVDVLVRTQPDGREFVAVRFTAFPAGEEPEPRQVGRWYWQGDDDKETRPILGEAALLDAMHRW